MKCSKKIADKVARYEKLKVEADELYEEIKEYFEEELGADGFSEPFITDEPTGHLQNGDEYCDQYCLGEDWYAVKVLLSCLQDLEYLRQKHDITMQLLKKYREIGTVDELITLKRKSIAVNPIKEPNANWDYEEIKCPNCGISLDLKSNYCSCGQRIIMEE